MPNLKLLYAGSFDPLHHGHCDIIDRARFMGDLTVLIASNGNKEPLLSVKERASIISEIYLPAISDVRSTPPRTFTGYWAKENEFDYLIRGVRGKDIDEELALASFNKEEFGIETILLPCDEKYRGLSSSLIKAVMLNDGWQQIVKNYVPGATFNRLTKGVIVHHG